MPTKKGKERTARAREVRAANRRKRKRQEEGDGSSQPDEHSVNESGEGVGAEGEGLGPEPEVSSPKNPEGEGEGAEGKGLGPEPEVSSPKNPEGEDGGPAGPPPVPPEGGEPEGEGLGPEPAGEPPAPPPVTPKRKRARRAGKGKTPKGDGDDDDVAPGGSRDLEQLPPLGDSVCVQCIRSALAGQSFGVCVPSNTLKCQHCKDVKKRCDPATGEVLRLGLKFLAAERNEATPQKDLGRVRSALREALEHDLQVKLENKEGQGGGKALGVPPGQEPVVPSGTSTPGPEGKAAVGGSSAASSSSAAVPTVGEAAGLRAAIDSLVGGHLPAAVLPAYNVLMDSYAASLRGR